MRLIAPSQSPLNLICSLARTISFLLLLNMYLIYFPHAGPLGAVFSLPGVEHNCDFLDLGVPVSQSTSCLGVVSPCCSRSACYTLSHHRPSPSEIYLCSRYLVPAAVIRSSVKLAVHLSVTKWCCSPSCLCPCLRGVLWPLLWSSVILWLFWPCAVAQLQDMYCFGKAVLLDKEALSYLQSAEGDTEGAYSSVLSAD